MSKTDTQYNEHFVLIVMHAYLILICLINAGHSIALSYDYLMVFNFSSAFLLSCSLIALKNKAPYVFTTNFMTTIALVHITNSCIVTGAQASPNLIYMMMIPVTTSFLLRLPYILFWLILTIICYTYLDNFFVDYYADKIYDMTQMDIQGIYVSNGISLSILYTLFTYSYKKRTNHIIHQNLKKKDELNNIIRIVSHDVSNPLHIIQLQTNSFLKKLDSDSPMSIGLLKINRSSHMIEAILQKVRNAEFIEKGVNYIIKDKLDIASIIDTSHFIFENKLKEKNLNLEIINELDKDTLVIGETIGFSHQLINNVLSNAIKFSNQDTTIKILIYEEGKDVCINISDKGIGIPNEILKNIFNKTKNKSRKGTIGEIGTGFGMPLVKSYIDQYNGSISIDTLVKDSGSDEHGTTIKIKLEKA
jgi:signal transduction histidine kinase